MVSITSQRRIQAQIRHWKKNITYIIVGDDIFLRRKAMPSHKRMLVNFKSKQLKQIVIEESKSRGRSISKIIEELIVYGFVARKYEGYADTDEIEAARGFYDMHQFLYAREFSIKHAPLAYDIFDPLHPHYTRTEFTFTVSSIINIDTKEAKIRLLSKKKIKEEIINNLTEKVRIFPNISSIHVVIVTCVTASFEQQIDRNTFTVKVVYDYLHTLLHPKEGDKQKYLLDIMKIKYRRYKDVLEKVGSYPNCSAILPIREAETQSSGGYFVGVLHKPVEFSEMKKVSVEKYGVLLAPFIDDEVISIWKSSFPKNKEKARRASAFDKYKLKEQG